MIIYVIRSFLQVGLRFQCQFINLVWFSFDFFSLSSSLTICCFVTLYSCVFAIVQKYHEMSFSYNYSHFQYSFFNQTLLFAQLEKVNKLWINNRTVHLQEQNQNKNKIKSRLFKLTTGSIVRFNPQSCNSPCGFSKNASFKVRVKPRFL